MDFLSKSNDTVRRFCDVARTTNSNCVPFVYTRVAYKLNTSLCFPNRNSDRTGKCPLTKSKTLIVSHKKMATVSQRILGFYNDYH